MSLSLGSSKALAQGNLSGLSLRELVYIESALELLEEILCRERGSFFVEVRRGRVRVSVETKEGSSAIASKEIALPSPRITLSTSDDAPASSNNGEET
jgi:hypothetical protein